MSVLGPRKFPAQVQPESYPFFVMGSVGGPALKLKQLACALRRNSEPGIPDADVAEFLIGGGGQGDDP